jgi:hypothetical protein
MPHGSAIVEFSLPPVAGSSIFGLRFPTDDLSMKKKGALRRGGTPGK